MHDNSRPAVLWQTRSKAPLGNVGNHRRVCAYAHETQMLLSESDQERTLGPDDDAIDDLSAVYPTFQPHYLTDYYERTQFPPLWMADVPQMPYERYVCW